jgi:hypothetical protein
MPRRKKRLPQDSAGTGRGKPRGDRRTGRTTPKRRRNRDESEAAMPFLDPPYENEDEFDFLDDDFDARFEFEDDESDFDDTVDYR